MKKVMLKVLVLTSLLCGCSSVQKNSEKPNNVCVKLLQFKSDSLVIYFEKTYSQDSIALEVRKVPISNTNTLCAYGIVAEDMDLIKRQIDAAADSLKMTFRVQLMYQHPDEVLTETTRLRFDIAR